MTERSRSDHPIVLHVEDQRGFQVAMQHQFRPSRLDCRSVGLVSEAAPFIGNRRVAAFIIDRLLPLDDEANFQDWGAYSHDALGLLRKIRRERPEVPVAVLTGFRDDRDLLALIEDGTIEEDNVWDKAYLDLDDFVRALLRRVKEARDASTQAEAPVVLNAWFEDGLGGGLQVGVKRRLLLTVGPWSQRSLLDPPGDERGATLASAPTSARQPQAPDANATFRFTINSGNCWVTPVRSIYAADLHEPAAFDVSLIDTQSSGEETLVIAVQRDNVLLHVERLTVATAAPARRGQETAHG